MRRIPRRLAAAVAMASVAAMGAFEAASAYPGGERIDGETYDRPVPGPTVGGSADAPHDARDDESWVFPWWTHYGCECQDYGFKGGAYGGWLGGLGGAVDPASLRGVAVGHWLTPCIPRLTVPVPEFFFPWFLADSDCAGAITMDDRKRFRMNRNRDSYEEAHKDGLAYCRRQGGESCQTVSIFRHCAAIATDRGAGVFGIGTARSGRRATDRALQACRQQGGRACGVEISARCNSG